MRIHLAVLAGLLVVGGVVIHGLRDDLQNERKKNAELQARLFGAPTRARKSTELSLQAQSPAPAGVGAIPPASSTAAAPGGDSSDAGEVNISELTRRAVSRARQDPEYLQAEHVLGRVYIMGIFPGVAADLGLNQDEARRFYDLLTDKRELQEGPPDAALAALLGASRLARWEEFQRTAEFRRSADSTVRLLATARLPLNAVQERGFVAAVVTEWQRQGRDIEMLSDRIPAASAAERTRIRQQMDELEENAEVRLLAAAAPHLNAEQLGLLRENAEAHRAQTRGMRRASRFL